MPQVDIDGLNSTLKADVIRGQAGTSTKLGGDLDLNGNDITGTGSIPAVSAQKNLIINGNFDIWQRGTSFTPATNEYGADRWQCDTGTTGSTYSQITSSLPEKSLYGIKLQRDSSTTSTNYIHIRTALETFDSVPLQGKVLTLSFYAKAGANLSSTSSQMSLLVATGTTGNEALTGFGGWAGNVYTLNTNQVLTTSWVKYSFTMPSNGTAIKQIGLALYFKPTGTAGADDSISIAQVQLEAGSVATDFEIRNHATELAMCQRYFERLNSADISDVNYGLLACAGATQAFGAVFWQVEKRAAPTTTCSSGTDFRVTNSGASPIETTSLTFAQANTQSVRAYAQVASGLAAGDVTRLHDDGLGNSYIDISAEL